MSWLAQLGLEGIGACVFMVCGMTVMAALFGLIKFVSWLFVHDPERSKRYWAERQTKFMAEQAEKRAQYLAMPWWKRMLPWVMPALIVFSAIVAAVSK